MSTNKEPSFKINPDTGGNVNIETKRYGSDNTKIRGFGEKVEHSDAPPMVLDLRVKTEREMFEEQYQDDNFDFSFTQHNGEFSYYNNDGVNDRYVEFITGRAPLLAEIDKWKRGFETYESAYKECYDEIEQLNAKVVRLSGYLNQLKSAIIPDSFVVAQNTINEALSDTDQDIQRVLDEHDAKVLTDHKCWNCGKTQDRAGGEQV